MHFFFRLRNAGVRPAGYLADPPADAKRAEIAAKEKKRREEGDDGPRPGRKPKEPSGEPAEKAQRNFTDPDSRIMKMGATESLLRSRSCRWSSR